METTQDFYPSFQAARGRLASRLDAVSGTADDALIKQLADDVRDIRKGLNDATPFLPTYDRRSCEEQLQELETRVEALRTSSAPKAKFSFKKKTLGSGSTTSIVPPTAPESTARPSEGQRQLAPAAASASTPGLTLGPTSYEYFTPASLSQPSQLPSGSASGTGVPCTDLTISGLDHCVVDLISRKSGAGQYGQNLDSAGIDMGLKAVHIHDVKDSLLLLGNVRGSVLVHNLERCTVVGTCHQLRVHSSHATRFHVHVASNAVIEDCSNLAFGPYPTPFPLPADVRAQTNTLHAVQDFSHLKSTPSPHWVALPDPDPESDGRWQSVLEALPSLVEEKTRRENLDKVLAWTLPKIK
ncbi:hypothetical protein M0805_006300 [Coniferiporia weirii]|nr:hypothetical protein M0805_006300 [Coniferiporia weirii]